MASPEAFDVLILGAGQAGNPLSRSLSAAGRRVALVERGPIGGTCVNTGCTPTKTMAASARVAHLARRAGDYGVRTGKVSVDLGEVRARKDNLVDEFRAGSEKKLEKADGLELIRGDAAFTGPKTVRVALNTGGERHLTAPVVVINVGGRPSVPKLPGLDAVPHLDSTSVMELAEVPEHLIVLGGGYIALEFAQMFRRFGSAVTVVQRGEQLLSKEDADVAGALADVLREDGIDIRLNAKATKVEKVSAGVRLTLESGSVTGSHLLVAVGRTPSTDTLNLQAAGIATDEAGHVRVDAKLETNVAGVYALGDCNGGPKFTHVAHHDNQILRENLLHGAGRTTAGRLVPYCVYTDPQLGRVGLSEAEARKQGRRVRVAKLPMSSVARALEAAEPRGLLKAVVDADTGLILGAACLGVEGGEIVSMLQIAMMGGVRFERLRDDMFAHPSLAEGLNNLFAHFEGE